MDILSTTTAQPTITCVSFIFSFFLFIRITRARPEHLDAIHNIQVKAYKDRQDFHESPHVFKAKLEGYPAGNFVAIATSSVVTDDDTTTWVGRGEKGDSDSDSDNDDDDDGDIVVEEQEQDGDTTMEQDFGGAVNQVTVVEIIETGADGSTTTFNSTTDETHIVRARTPDIIEGGDDRYDDDNHVLGHGDDDHLSTFTFREKTSIRTEDENGVRHHHHHHQHHYHHHPGHEVDDDDDDKHMTTILFQWEEPVGYLLSHPYSQETIGLHRVGNVGVSTTTTTTTSSEEPSKTKKMRIDPKNGSDDDDDDDSTSESDEYLYDHDSLMEKYYVHDCAIHPDYRGKGLAANLWKALEESLIPAKDSDQNLNKSSGIIDTEDEDEENEDDDLHDAEQTGSSTSTDQHRHGQHRHRRHRHHRKHGKNKNSSRKGAPNLKEIFLVSVQGTQPFWERVGGFEAVNDHDVDLSSYGLDAQFMKKAFIF
ncbi:hypothetical protein BGZ76_001723 [Entomortierella beljakovae]|nr:hypothetical protein BGZ76_001723 [Entomortierella beljakovae]